MGKEEEKKEKKQNIQELTDSFNIHIIGIQEGE